MADATTTEELQPQKGGKLPLLLGIVLMLLGGGGGFFAASSGMIFAPGETKTQDVKKEVKDVTAGVSFIPLDPIAVSLSPGSPYKHLRFRAELEVNEAYRSEVKKILPRVIDVLNSYLRAVKPSDLAQPAALTRLRAQMLRRAQIVSGPERINDLLIMEFVLN